MVFREPKKPVVVKTATSASEWAMETQEQKVRIGHPRVIIYKESSMIGTA